MFGLLLWGARLTSRNQAAKMLVVLFGYLHEAVPYEIKIENKRSYNINLCNSTLVVPILILIS